MKGGFSNAGFYLALGVAAGLLISDLTQGQMIGTASGSGSASRYEDFCMVTGRSADSEVDILWLLDYRSGRLQCIILGRNGRLGAMGEIDLLQQFDMEKGSKANPHFMMVTGRHMVAATDVCYLAEVTSGQVLCIAPPATPARGTNFVPTPRVVDRFQFRREQIRKQ